jgi:guanylate kinase
VKRAGPNRKNGLLICLSGPSGVGKGTVIERLKANGTCLEHSVSITTRSPRPGEVDGLSYYFVTEAEFEEKIAAGEILEHDRYCGHYYGTPRLPIVRKMAAGIDVIMDVTVPGSLATMANFPAAISIYLLPPSFSELRRRLCGRGTEPPEVVEQRMKKAEAEVRQASRFDYIIVNKELDETTRLIHAILDAERHRSSRQLGIAEEILVE